MKLLLNKTILIKLGIAVAVVAIAALNFSLTNAKNLKSLTTVAKAKAETQMCVTAPNMVCYAQLGCGDDDWHFFANYENVEMP